MERTELFSECGPLDAAFVAWLQGSYLRETELAGGGAP